MRTFLLAVILALAGCAVGAVARGEREQAALDRELAGRVSGAPRSCVSGHSSQSLQALGNGIFVYRDGATIWVSRPRQRRPGFSPQSTLIVERHGSEYCRGDRVRAIDPGSTIPGPVCVLGDFVPYRRP